jgi:dCTP deaminase
VAVLGKCSILKSMDRGDIVITPFNPNNLGLMQYDVTLGDIIYRVKHVGALKQCFKNLLNRNGFCIDLGKDESKIRFKRIEANSSGFIIQSGETVLGCTNELIGSNCANIVPVLETRSTLARNFVFSHVSAGVGDPGFKGSWTLELVNCFPYPIRLVPGQRVSQVLFHFIEEPDYDAPLYNRIYNNQKEPHVPKLI